jgi:hypothetical protein
MANTTTDLGTATGATATEGTAAEGTATAATTAAAQEAFDTIRKCVALFGAISAIVLGTAAVLAFTRHTVNPFMWVRGGIMIAVAPMLLRYVAEAQNGSRESFDRVRTLATIVPIALIGVDLIPGLCPAWYAAMQGLSALALAGVAVVMRRSPLRAAFPKK